MGMSEVTFRVSPGSVFSTMSGTQLSSTWSVSSILSIELYTFPALFIPHHNYMGFSAPLWAQVP